jgi:hypothetical protein
VIIRAGTSIRRGASGEPVCGCAPVELLEASQEELLRDQAEAVRLAYVAATRARDLLVVPACGDQPLPGWLEVLNPALHPPDDAKCQSEPVPGAPSFGAESVIDRGPQGVSPDGDCVRPGLHKPCVGTHTVAWWDPNVLALEAEENFGVRQQRILEADETGTEVARGEQSYNQASTGTLPRRMGTPPRGMPACCPGAARTESAQRASPLNN